MICIFAVCHYPQGEIMHAFQMPSHEHDIKFTHLNL